MTVRVNKSPVTDRIFRVGMIGEISKDGKFIRISGQWFSFDERWEVEEVDLSKGGGK